LNLLVVCVLSLLKTLLIHHVERSRFT